MESCLEWQRSREACSFSCMVVSSSSAPLNVGLAFGGTEMGNDLTRDRCDTVGCAGSRPWPLSHRNGFKVSSACTAGSVQLCSLA